MESSGRDSPHERASVDWRVYPLIFMDRWWLLIGLPLLLVIAALITYFVSPKEYESRAMVAITGVQYAFQFNPLEDQPIQIEDSPYRAYQELATADELLQAILMEVGGSLPAEQRNLASLKRMLAAEAASDPSIIEFTVTSRSAALAAEIANTWAKHFTDYVNEIYQGASLDITFFSGQAEDAHAKLDEAEDNLINFQARNLQGVLEAQLRAKTSLYEDYLARRAALVIVKDNIQSLRGELEAIDPETPGMAGEHLIAILLQVEAIGTELGAPIQIQFTPPDSDSGITVLDQIHSLDRLETIVDDQLAQMEIDLEKIPPEILELQQGIQKAESEGQRLNSEIDLARESYTSISRKLDETRILAQSGERTVKLASEAVIPGTPSSPDLSQLLSLALSIGLVASVSLILVLEYLRPRQLM